MNKQGFTVSTWGGHVLDLYRLLMFDVRNPYSYSKVRQIRALAHRTRSRVFIEAGTFLGNTAKRCSRDFAQVITMELDAELFDRASKYLQRMTNVTCLQGDALKLLPGVLDQAHVHDALVYLDGHFSGGVTAHGQLAEPACEEIAVLAHHRAKINAVIVDDFRCFGRDPGWPSRSLLLRTIEESFGDDFDYTVHMDQVLVWRTRAPQQGHRPSPPARPRTTRAAAAGGIC